jgi:DNA polymerase-3 subunit delta
MLGPDATLRDAAVSELCEAALGGGPRDFNEDRFDLAASGLDVDRILTAARTLPMLAPRRVVRVRGLGDRKAARFLESQLPGYLEDPAPTTCLVLEADKVDRRLKWVKQVGKLGEVRDCSGPTRPAEVRRWIEDRIREAGKKPGRGVAAALLDLVGVDLDQLANEVAKAALYAGDRENLTAEDVSVVTGQLRPRALYELTEAIGLRNRAQALHLLGDLMEQGEAPLALLGALSNHFRRLIRARECRPLEAREVQRRLSIHPFAAQKVAEQASGFDPVRLRSCLDAIRRTDEALKGADPLPPRLAVERLVLAVSA